MLTTMENLRSQPTEIPSQTCLGIGAPLPATTGRHELVAENFDIPLLSRLPVSISVWKLMRRVCYRCAMNVAKIFNERLP